MKLEVSTCIWATSPGLGQEVYFWIHGAFLHTLSWGIVFEFSSWFLFGTTLQSFCTTVGIWSVSHVPGIKSGMAEFLEIEATRKACIWFRDMGTHTGKHCFHAGLVQIWEPLVFLFPQILSSVIYASQVHRDSQPRMNFLFRNLGRLPSHGDLPSCWIGTGFLLPSRFTTVLMY